MGKFRATLGFVLLFAASPGAHATLITSVFDFSTVADGQYDNLSFNDNGLVIEINPYSSHTGTDRVQVHNGGLGVAGTEPGLTGQAAFGINPGESLAVLISVASRFTWEFRGKGGWFFIDYFAASPDWEWLFSIYGQHGTIPTGWQLTKLTVEWDPTGVPEPSSLALLSMGLLGMALTRGRRRRSKSD